MPHYQNQNLGQNEPKLPEIPKLNEELKTEQIIRISEEYAQACRSVSVNQIRNLYSNISNLRMKYKSIQKEKYFSEKVELKDKEEIDKLIDVIYSNILKLKVYTMYSAGRDGKGKDYDKYFKPFILSIVNSTINNYISLGKFFEFIESFVGFHKY